MGQKIARVLDTLEPVSVTVTTASGRHYQATLKPGTTYPISSEIVEQFPWAFQVEEVVEEATAEPGRKRAVKSTRKTASAPAPTADDGDDE